MSIDCERKYMGQLYQLLNTACEIAKVDKINVIEIVKIKRSITNLLD
jgi:hypothetical protein